MADVSISGTLTPASGTPSTIHPTGAAISAKAWVYLDSGELKTADAGTAAEANVAGIVLSAYADGQDAVVYGDGAIINSTTSDFTAGLAYALGNNSDGAMTADPATDNSTNDYYTWVCVALSATQIQVRIIATGAQVA